MRQRLHLYLIWIHREFTECFKSALTFLLSENCTLKVAYDWLYFICGNDKQNYHSWTKENTLFWTLLRIELSDEFKPSYFFANHLRKTLQIESKCYNYKQLYLKYEFPVALVIQDRSQCNSDSSSQIRPVAHIQ